MDRLIQRSHSALISAFMPLLEYVLPQCSLNSAQSIWSHRISCTDILLASDTLLVPFTLL